MHVVGEGGVDGTDRMVVLIGVKSVLCISVFDMRGEYWIYGSEEKTFAGNDGWVDGLSVP